MVVLAAGLVVVLVVVGLEPDITFARLRGFVATTNLPQPVGTVWPEFDFPAVSPFSAEIEHRSWLETILFDVVYLASTMAIGSTVVPAIQGDDEWPAPVRILAGFLPGYLMVIAPLQLLFGMVPLATATWIGLVAMPVAALALHRRCVVAGVRGMRLGMPRRGGMTVAVGLATALACLGLIHRLQQGVFYLTQDSIGYFIKLDVALISTHARYLAHWKSQTDEWLYSAPLRYSDGGVGDLWWAYYLVQGVAVVAFLCLLYGVVHRVARRRKAVAGALAVAVVFGGTLAIYPWVYITIVGGGQPVLSLAHPGRLIGIIGPWVAVLFVLTPRRAPIWALALLTLGLGFTTLNNVLYVGGAIAVVVIWRLLRARPELLRSAAARGAVHGMLAATVVLPVAAFAFTSGTPSSAVVPVVLLAAACVAGLLGAAVIAWSTTKDARPLSARPVLKWFGVWVAAAAAGLLFSDNLGVSTIGKQAHDALAPILPGFGLRAVARAEIPDGAFTGLSFPSFSQAACNSNESCGGIPYFLLCYGLLFSLAVAVWVGYGRLRADDEQVNVRRGAMLLGLGLLPAALIMVFFAGAGTIQAGALTRLLEWPSYTLLVLVVLGFCEARERLVVWVGVAFLVVWAIVPLISFEWPQQFVRNAGWYVGQLF